MIYVYNCQNICYDVLVKKRGQIMTISTGAMSWLVFIIFGGIAGWIASIICKRNGSMGIIANIVVGIIGSVIGRFVMEEFFQ